MGRISPGPTRWPPGAERRLVPAKPDLKTRTSAHAEQAAAQDLDLWIDRLTTAERLALEVSIRLLLTSRSCHLEEGTRTMADITFSHRAEHAPPATTDHPGGSHYVAIRLTAHMGAYSLDKMIGLHWL